MSSFNAAFQWLCHPEAEQFFLQTLSHSISKNGALQKISQDLTRKTSTRLFDWVDHVMVPESEKTREKLQHYGFQEEGEALCHPGAQFPAVVFGDEYGVALLVESIADFLMVRGLCKEIEGSLLSPFRRSLIHKENGVSFWVVERRGSRTREPTYPSLEYVSDYLELKELWQTRPRRSQAEEDEIEFAIDLAKECVGTIGRDVAAWLVLEAERAFWQAKNRAGQMQKARQDRLGMGWANHDHHTFRSSRRLFTKLVELFEVLGFHCRERFYAGEQAHWGAQVMENRTARLTLFLDVDLTPDEVSIDFAHQGLPQEHSLGTIGLWCALHGDSILKAGMHHLEAQFEFQALQDDLHTLGVKMMKPFSDFSFLKQAFTEGEWWEVEGERVDPLVKKGLITEEIAAQFKEKGAVGSHLENLQRREGYKGFNQKNVSDIIRKTDPREVTYGD